MIQSTSLKAGSNHSCAAPNIVHAGRVLCSGFPCGFFDGLWMHERPLARQWKWWSPPLCYAHHPSAGGKKELHFCISWNLIDFDVVRHNNKEWSWRPTLLDMPIVRPEGKAPGSAPIPVSKFAENSACVRASACMLRLLACLCECKYEPCLCIPVFVLAFVHWRLHAHARTYACITEANDLRTSHEMRTDTNKGTTLTWHLSKSE